MAPKSVLFCITGLRAQLYQLILILTFFLCLSLSAMGGAKLFISVLFLPVFVFLSPVWLLLDVLIHSNLLSEWIHNFQTTYFLFNQRVLTDSALWTELGFFN